MSAAREVPVVASPARGTFRARLSEDGTSFAYTLDYEGFEGTVTQAHIHIAQPFASGGISVWLCKTAAATPPTTVPADTPTCGAAWRRRARGGRRHFGRGRDRPDGPGGSGCRFRGSASPDARGLRLRERALHLRSGRRGARPDPAHGPRRPLAARTRRVPLAAGSLEAHVASVSRTRQRARHPARQHETCFAGPQRTCRDRR